MIHQRIWSEKQRLDHVYSRVAKFNLDQSLDPEISSYLARYLCIATSGFLEWSVQTLLVDYSDKRSSPEVTRFVTLRIKEFQNPKMNAIIDLISRFSPDWAEELKAGTDGILKDGVDSLVSERCNIAHGSSSDITYYRVKDYYDRAYKVLEMISEKCSKQ